MTAVKLTRIHSEYWNSAGASAVPSTLRKGCRHADPEKQNYHFHRTQDGCHYTFDKRSMAANRLTQFCFKFLHYRAFQALKHIVLKFHFKFN